MYKNIHFKTSATVIIAQAAAAGLYYEFFYAYS
jgi:hypothetical protein